MSARKAIALLTCNASLGDDYPGALRLGVEQGCRAADADLWVYGGRNAWDASGDQHQIFGLIDSSRIDGIVIATGVIAAYTPLDEVLATLRRRCDVPMCAVGQKHAEMSSIVVDNQTGVSQAIDHLVTVHGCRRFACIAGPRGHEESEVRLAGAREALARHGLECGDDAVARGSFGIADGREALAELLARCGKLDAVIAGNDNMAKGAVEAIEAVGLRCPADVAVVGFDDAASARYAAPPLTTVRQPAVDLGRMAVEHLVRAWQGSRETTLTVLDTELVIRESCGCSAARRAVQPGDPAPLEPTLEQLLRGVFVDPEHASRWAGALVAALAAETQSSAAAHPPPSSRPSGGESAAAPGDEWLGVLRQLIDALPEPRAPLDDLQRVVTALRDALDASARARFETAFEEARVLVGNERQRLIGAAKLRGDQLIEQLRATSERFARSLNLDVLKSEMGSDLPRLDIAQGVVALYPPGDPGALVPLICFRDGQELEGVEGPYPATMLVPDPMSRSARRRSLTVMPLTCELEQLGVAVLELPLGTDAYNLLREQLSAAIKAVRLHEEILARERMHAQVEQEQRATQERLRSLNLIAGSVAHDLNNALGPLVALPETIRQELEQGSPSMDVADDLESIRLAGLRAAHTIRDLFVLGRPDQAPRKRFDLNRLLRRQSEELARLCDRPGVRFRLEPDESPLVIRASESQVISAVTNLIQNAVEAIDGDGLVVVRARATSVPDLEAGEGRVPPGDYAVIQVQDTGSGIEPELMPHILEPFFSANPRRSGSKGLGLAIVQRLLRDCGGDVQVESEPGRGSTFSLFFPLLIEDSARSSVPGSRPRGGRERILVIDDEPAQLRTARRILAQLGYDVAVAGSGEEAVKVCSGRDDGDAFDLLIVDMVMPGGLNGLSTVSQIRRRRPMQKALIASGYAPEHLSAAAAREGLPWLSKPYTLARLASAVRHAIGTAGIDPGDAAASGVGSR